MGGGLLGVLKHNRASMIDLDGGSKYLILKTFKVTK